MSIFNKVLILFLISLFLMIFVSNTADRLTQETLASLLKEKYIQSSDELFKYLSNNDIYALERKLEELKLKTITDKEHYFNESKTIYSYKTELSTIEILQHEDKRYILYLSYLDDDILVIDSLQNRSFEEIESLNYLILADIAILIILFLLILKMIYPLKKISKSIKRFGEGSYNSRVEKITNDEIGELSSAFNSMASNIEELITSRERLLRDIGHELKTPIAKSKLAIEMIYDSKYKKILNRAILQMDEMIHELLDIERLSTNQHKLKKESFDTETLISTSLSKLFIDDESLIDIEIESNFKIESDLQYLSIALKNLIDNALKYSIKKPIYIVVQDNKILVKSRGKKLEKPLKYYCEVFTQGDSSREQKGHGLGLSLVKSILNRHGFKLIYLYDDGLNIFLINFIKSS